MAATDIPPAARAAAHLDGFVRALGEAGVRAPMPRRIDFLRATTLLPPASIDALYWTARVTLLTRLEEIEPFDDVFDAWFRAEPRPRLEARPAPGGERGESAAPGPTREGELGPADPGGRTGLEASGIEVVSRKTFPPTDEDAGEVLAELRRALPAALPTVQARRLRRARAGRRLDLARVCREANRTGGEVVRLHWRSRPHRTRPVLLLIDVSGSMKQHSADLLRFAHAAVGAVGRVEVFTFGTRLTRVTERLREPDVDSALASLGGVVLDADAGTRIGDALDGLLATPRYQRHVRGALVVVLSDGLERGDCEAMVRCSRRLELLAHRLVWWSPLACSPGYRPVTRGLQEVLQGLDELAGVRDLDSALEAVRRLPRLEAEPRRSAARAWAAALETEGR